MITIKWLEDGTVITDPSLDEEFDFSSAISDQTDMMPVTVNDTLQLLRRDSHQFGLQYTVRSSHLALSQCFVNGEGRRGDHQEERESNEIASVVQAELWRDTTHVLEGY